LLGDRVTRAAAIATPAPVDLPGLDWLGAMNPLNVAEFGAAQRGVGALAAELEPYVELGRREPGAFVDELAAALPAADRAALAEPAAHALWTESFAESMRQGAAGWVDDDLAFVRPWGFTPADVRVETRFLHGELDDLAPRPHGEALAAAIPGARFELVPAAGHIVYDAWPPLLEWLAAGEGP
jgi:pimeloyl-ACP methyl ester carboxylesterase